MKVKENINTNKRVASTKKYINSLVDKYSKLNVVRVDLGYKKNEDTNKVEVTLEEANSDLDRMMNNRRSKPSIFKHNVGYIIKKEYTEDKGVHLHAVFLFDGQKVQHDIHKATQVGEYWNQVAHDNCGTYFNCNRKKEKYSRMGIGMIEHTDVEKRKILEENVLHYLCKDEQSIKDMKENKQNRAFVRGSIPKTKSNAGRPRNNS